MTTGVFPRWLYLPATLGLLFAAVPVAGLLIRMPWPRLPALLATPAAQEAIWLSLRTCLASLLLTVALGLPLALLASRARGRWALPVRVLTTLPMVLPPVVAGLALLVTLGRRGLIGASLSLLGVQVGFTTLAVVIAQTFVSMPFFVIAVDGALRTHDTGFERAAAILGASPTRTLTRVTLPLLAPAICSGAAMALARALGEFGATLTFAGSLQGVTQTLPQAIYLQREIDPESALSLAGVLVALAAVLMAVATWLGRPRR